MVGRFVGETSMGFIHGKVYELKSSIEPIGFKDGFKMDMKTCIVLRDKYSKAWCPYNSLEAVLRNWEFNLIRTEYNHIV